MMYNYPQEQALPFPMEPCPWEIPMPVHGTKNQKFQSQWAGLELLWKFQWELGIPNGTENNANRYIYEYLCIFMYIYIS